jgi:pimeloyl-ACP methyl ester carboxylesterase
VVCLPGLTRSTVDFDPLAVAIANDPDRPRQVLAVDYRGRGQSEYDPNTGNYTIAVELADLLAVLTALEVDPAVFVGTSRGGILAMLLATVRPAAIAGVVLNDIGPVIETKGLMRIKSYVGQLPQPRSFEEGAELLRRLFSAQFPRLDQDEWVAFARRSFEERDGTLQPRYDRNLAKMLQSVRPEQPSPTLWKEFDALMGVPVMAIRGANSDLLSAATVEAMRARHPALDSFEVPDEGHAPLLAGSDIIGRIAAFVAGV